ncbi:colicin immunity domain-containing protein [Streptomyces armeniacus]|uniref:colicin immunity domain-containing protein n=1 Tax=Streptomyces armeniacus TaxID=83291 RepID=UPI001AD835B7|nr:colicin immunity domain-containing protein [Streptomyces armeniacus]
MPANTGVGRELIDRAVSGSKEAAAHGIYLADLAPGKADEEIVLTSVSRDVMADATNGINDPCIMAASNLEGAILVTQQGYALIAGSADYLSGALAEGVDEARARFRRYASRVGSPLPEIRHVADLYTPRSFAWSSKSAVEPGSSTHEQLRLMQSMASGEITAPEFAQEWQGARRRAMEQGERVTTPLEDALDRVFYAIEDYSFSPELQEPGDLTDEDLLTEVAEALNQLDP